MKKLFLASAIALFATVSAQEYKPAAGDVTVDLGVSGGLGNTSIGLADGGAAFKVRYFKTDKLAYRFTMVLANNSDTDNSVTNVVSKDNDFALGLGFGAEKHFTGTDRLSPYVGGDIMIGYASQSSKSTFTPTSGTAVVSEVKGPNTFGAGVRGVFGADYYFAKRVFLGVEAGLSLMYSSEGDTTTSLTGSPDVTVKGGSNFNISPSVVTGIRIGYAF
ncbi:hypothetical protein FNJ88_12730 [Chryseobacterium sp. SNU WT5]|uniref:hypothetical protein n=1 Tax=Chryseobacterium sp. SNU WT5 TaxID=2594269 RepID=UPI00117DACB9|nr:hypothetical protein [Chryseobacterium sp. SNU WT5]QDP86373.1 hypothetical protein FNJ88_12730 [Chryseobacterium sp. SNU WT5]